MINTDVKPHKIINNSLQKFHTKIEDQKQTIRDLNAENVQWNKKMKEFIILCQNIDILENLEYFLNIYHVYHLQINAP
jgi:hypothetical protein